MIIDIYTLHSQPVRERPSGLMKVGNQRLQYECSQRRERELQQLNAGGACCWFRLLLKYVQTCSWQ